MVGAWNALSAFSRDPSASDEAREAADEAWKSAHEQGPIALVIYRPDGKSPLSPMTMGIGFLLDVGVAGIAAMLLAMCGPSLPFFGRRLLFVFLLGVYTVFGTNLMNWNWMNYPLQFTLEAAADTLVASLLLGIVLAAIVKPGYHTIDSDEISAI